MCFLKVNVCIIFIQGVTLWMKPFNFFCVIICVFIHLLFEINYVGVEIGFKYIYVLFLYETPYY